MVCLQHRVDLLVQEICVKNANKIKKINRLLQHNGHFPSKIAGSGDVSKEEFVDAWTKVI